MTDVDPGTFMRVLTLLYVFEKDLSEEEMRAIAEEISKGNVRNGDPLDGAYQGP